MAGFVSMLGGLVGSRKWAVGLVTAGILAMNKKLGLNLSEVEVASIAGLVSAVVLGEAAKDAKAAAVANAEAKGESAGP